MTDKVTTPVAILNLQLLSLKEAGERLAAVHAIIPDGILPARSLDNVPDFYEISAVEYLPASTSVEVTVHRVPVRFNTEEYSNLRQALSPMRGMGAPTDDEPILPVTSFMGDRQFSFTIPLAYAQTALLLSSTTATPFLVVSRERDAAKMDPSTGYSGLSSVIASPQFGSALFSRLNNVIQKASTGRVIASLSPAEISSVRFQAIRIISGLAAGRRDALLEMYSHINAYNAIAAKSENEAYIPEDDEQQLIALQDFIFLLLRNASANSIGTYLNLISATSEEEAKAEVQVTENELNAFEDLMKNAGFSEADADFFSSEPGFTTVNSSSSKQEKMAFLREPVTVENLPPSMRPIKEQIVSLAPLWTIDWNDENKEDKTLDTGDAIASAAVMTAIRLSRAQHVAPDDNVLKSLPIALMVFLSFPTEQIVWGVVETVKNLPSPDGLAFFNDVIGFPSPSYRKDPRSLIVAPAGYMLHQFGHAVLTEGWSDDIIRNTFKDLDIILSFLDDVKENASQMEGREVEEGMPVCPVAQAIAGLITLGFQLPQISDQLGQALLRLADLNAWQSSGVSSNTVEWKEYQVEYLETLASDMSHHQNGDDDDDDDDD